VDEPDQTFLVERLKPSEQASEMKGEQGSLLKNKHTKKRLGGVFSPARNIAVKGLRLQSKRPPSSQSSEQRSMVSRSRSTAEGSGLGFGIQGHSYQGRREGEERLPALGKARSASVSEGLRLIDYLARLPKEEPFQPQLSKEQQAMVASLEEAAALPPVASSRETRLLFLQFKEWSREKAYTQLVRAVQTAEFGLRGHLAKSGVVRRKAASILGRHLQHCETHLCKHLLRVYEAVAKCEHRREEYPAPIYRIIFG
jgi:hypothetical protein